LPLYRVAAAWFKAAIITSSIQRPAIGSRNPHVVENVPRTQLLLQTISNLSANMATKYAFTQGLREVRFHLCSSSPASEAAR